MSAFTDRAGLPITEQAWELLSADYNYRHLFEELFAGSMRIVTIWAGYSAEGMMDDGDTFVTMTLGELDGDERLLPQFTRSYATESEAILGHLEILWAVLDSMGMTARYYGIHKSDE